MIGGVATLTPFLSSIFFYLSTGFKITINPPTHMFLCFPIFSFRILNDLNYFRILKDLKVKMLNFSPRASSSASSKGPASPQPAHSQQAQPTVIFTTRFGTKNWRMRTLSSNHGGGHPFLKKLVILLPTGIPAGLIWSYIFSNKIEGRVPTLQPSPSAIKSFFKNVPNPKHGFSHNLNIKVRFGADRGHI